MKKCKAIIALWEGERLSLIGKVLILNIKVIPKLFYLLQSIEPVDVWNAKFKIEFRQVICGGFSKVPLSILEWGRTQGGLGLVSIVQKARSLRFGVLKNYLDREDVQYASQLTPVNSVLVYFLDVPV